MAIPTIDDVIHALAAVAPRMDMASTYYDMRAVCDAIPHDALGTAVLLMASFSVRKPSAMSMVESVAWHTMASRLGAGPGCIRPQDGIPWLRTADADTIAIVTDIANQWHLGQHPDRDTFFGGGHPVESFWISIMDNVLERRRTEFAAVWLSQDASS